MAGAVGLVLCLMCGAWSFVLTRVAFKSEAVLALSTAVSFWNANFT